MGSHTGLVVLIAVIVVLAVSGGVWCSWTAGRLDRMHLRIEAAAAALDGQLQRRASVAAELATSGDLDPASALIVLAAARIAREASDDEAARWPAESDLTAALLAVELPADEPLVVELGAAGRGAAMARRIHNDLAGRARRLRNTRRVRLLRLAGRAVTPRMIDFDDRYELTVVEPDDL